MPRAISSSNARLWKRSGRQPECPHRSVTDGGSLQSCHIFFSQFSCLDVVGNIDHYVGAAFTTLRQLNIREIHQRLARGAHARDGLDGVEAVARGDGGAAGAQAIRAARCDEKPINKALSRCYLVEWRPWKAQHASTHPGPSMRPR